MNKKGALAAAHCQLCFTASSIDQVHALLLQDDSSEQCTHCKTLARAARLDRVLGQPAQEGHG